jgi:glutamate-1-semialdehyde 2,1-aminomutase
MNFAKSKQVQDRFHKIIPGGSHTYAKGDDQFPEPYPIYIARGKGCHVWDLDGNKYIEYGMGLRAVTLGHAYDRVVTAAYNAMLNGNNFVRPSHLELECAEQLLSMIKDAEMVKFGKNGSDATSAAIRLSRAYTGREIVAICIDHPFFSVDDWFISTTPMSAGIPNFQNELIVKFHYNNIDSLLKLYEQYPDKIACVMLEPEKNDPPKDNFLNAVRKITEQNGSVLILDEMITGFRWHNGGGQAFHKISPDLSTFGKAIGNGFSVSALVGKKEIMELGGIKHERERVFLLSLTHGAESPSLAAALATMKIYEEEPVIEFLWKQGERLIDGITKSINENKLGDYVQLFGRPCCLVYGTKDQEKEPSQPFRTLFLQEIIKRGVLAPSLVVSYSHDNVIIDQTIEVFHESLMVYRKALDEGIEKYLQGRPVKPVFRKYC